MNQVVELCRRWLLLLFCDDWQFLLEKKRKSVLSCSYYSPNNLFVLPTVHTHTPHCPYSFPYYPVLFYSHVVLPLSSILFSPLLSFGFYLIMNIPLAQFSLKTLSLVYLLLCKPHQAHSSGLPDCWPSLLSVDVPRLFYRSPQSQRAGPRLSFGFFFHSTYCVSAEPYWLGWNNASWANLAKVSSSSKSAVLSSVVQGSVLSASLHFNSLDLPLVMWQSSARRLLESCRGQCFC